MATCHERELRTMVDTQNVPGDKIVDGLFGRDL